MSLKSCKCKPFTLSHQGFYVYTYTCMACMHIYLEYTYMALCKKIHHVSVNIVQYIDEGIAHQIFF
jgi:hypothetical protein